MLRRQAGSSFKVGRVPECALHNLFYPTCGGLGPNPVGVLSRTYFSAVPMGAEVVMARACCGWRSVATTKASSILMQSPKYIGFKVGESAIGLW